MRFLLFSYYPLIGAMGEIAPGERRMAFSRPARSAVLGLIGAALGLRRDDPAHADLEHGLGYAVRTDSPGRPFTDYHTAQTPQQRRGTAFATRRDELAADTLNTVLSVREWRTDALYTIALWERVGAALGLDAVAAALNRPHFVLYAGRKAGPLGLPLAPRFVDAAGVLQAFAADPVPAEQRRIIDRVLQRARPRGSDALTEIAFDLDGGVAAEAEHVETRRDAVVSRARFQFGERREGVVLLGTGNG
jgi:CRISPR system Cascade subunit CasD